MNVLILSQRHNSIGPIIQAQGDTVQYATGPITADDFIGSPIDFIISYGYRHIIKEPILSAFRGRLINLHISLLPWNKGADPNFWSFFDGTPKGVTIHQMDKGIDTGSVLAASEVVMRYDETLATSYHRLHAAMNKMFCDYWLAISRGCVEPKPQSEAGSYHHSKESKFLMSRLPDGFDTPCSTIEGIGEKLREMAAGAEPVLAGRFLDKVDNEIRQMAD